MNVLIQGSVAFGIFLATHLVLWRLRVPKNAVRALFFLLVLVTAAFTLVHAAAYAALLDLPPAARLGPAELAYALLFWGSTGMSYLVSYPAIEGESPSSLIALAVDRAGPQGLPRTALQSIITDEIFMRPRLAALLADGLAVQEAGLMKITKKGGAYLRLFMLPWKLTGGAQRGG